MERRRQRARAAAAALPVVAVARRRQTAFLKRLALALPFFCSSLSCSCFNPPRQLSFPNSYEQDHDLVVMPTPNLFLDG